MFDSRVIKAGEVSLEKLLETVFGLEGAEGRGGEYGKNYYRVYQRIDGSGVQFTLSYDKDDNVTARSYHYILLKKPPAVITVPGREYTGSRLQFDLFLGPVKSGTEDYETENGGDSWVIRAKRDGRNGYYVLPYFDRDSFGFVDEMPEEEDTSHYVLTEHKEEFIAALDLQGIREIRIKDYSPEVITLGGFCEGTYYAVERPDLYVPGN
jgi:hypothetical protein